MRNWPEEIIKWMPHAAAGPGGRAPASRHLSRHHVFVVDASVNAATVAARLEQWESTPGGALVISFSKFAQLVLQSKPPGPPSKAALAAAASAAAAEAGGGLAAEAAADPALSRAAELSRKLTHTPAAVVVDEGEGQGM